MAGIAGSHADSLAPVIPTTEAAASGIEAQQAAKPVQMQPAPDQAAGAAPAQPAAEPAQQNEPDYAALFQQVHAKGPDYAALFAQVHGDAEKAKPEASLVDQFSQTPGYRPEDRAPTKLGEAAINSLPAIGMGLGAAAGGVAGLTAGPLAGVAAPTMTVGGAAVGKATGEGLKNMILAGLGRDEAPKGVKNAFAKVGDAVATGAIEQATAEISTKLLTTAAEAAMPTVRSVANKFMESEIGKKMATASGKVTSQVLETYKNSGDKIANLFKQYGEELSGMSTDAKEQMNTAIETTKKQMNTQITTELATNNSKVSVKPILSKLENVYNSLTPAEKLSVEGQQVVKLIEEKADYINKVVGAHGGERIPLIELHNIRNDLMSVAYSPETPRLAANAFKDAGAGAKEIIGRAAPEVSQANGILQQFYDLKDKMKPSILSEQAGASEILKAGRGQGESIENLKKLGELTGTNPLGHAQDMAAAETFKKVGSAGLSDIKQALVNRQLTPSMTKTLIDLGRIPKEAVEKLGGLDKLQGMTSSRYGQIFLGELVERADGGKKLEGFINKFGKPLELKENQH